MCWICTACLPSMAFPSFAVPPTCVHLPSLDALFGTFIPSVIYEKKLFQTLPDHQHPLRGVFFLGSTKHSDP